MTDFFWRCYVRAMTQPQPKFIQRLGAYDGGPVKMPRLWQIMVLPVLILLVAFVVTR